MGSSIRPNSITYRKTQLLETSQGVNFRPSAHIVQHVNNDGITLEPVIGSILLTNVLVAIFKPNGIRNVTQRPFLFCGVHEFAEKKNVNISERSLVPLCLPIDDKALGVANTRDGCDKGNATHIHNISYFKVSSHLLTICWCTLSSVLERKQQTGTWTLSFRPSGAASTPKS